MSALHDDEEFDCFINYDILKTLKGFPRCPDCNNLTTPMSEFNREESLIIFVSHCWLRPKDNNPHPDNCDNDKFDLCVNGIDWIWRNEAPRMKYCYLWIDYSCIDQNNRTALPKLSKRYDKIVQYCDAIFTPIVDKKPTVSSLSKNSDYEPYHSPLWNEGPNAYLNRAWCRVELLYAAYIPLLNDGVPRNSLFERRLSHLCKLSKRPHFVYSNLESQERCGPRLIPELQNLVLRNLGRLQSYKPENGNLSVSSDIKQIKDLTKVLQYYIEQNLARAGYVGENDADGCNHGFGTEIFKDGSKYTGQWLNGCFHGRGILYLSDGSLYDGEFKDHMAHGVGEYTSYAADKFVGKFHQGIRHGKLTTYRVTGEVFCQRYIMGLSVGPISGRSSSGENFMIFPVLFILLGAYVAFQVYLQFVVSVWFFISHMPWNYFILYQVINYLLSKLGNYCSEKMIPYLHLYSTILPTRAIPLNTMGTALEPKWNSKNDNVKKILSLKSMLE